VGIQKIAFNRVMIYKYVCNKVYVCIQFIFALKLCLFGMVCSDIVRASFRVFLLDVFRNISSTTTDIPFSLIPNED
jgi:hypothetical protein